MKKMSGWQKAGLFAGVGCFSIVLVLVIGVGVAVFMAKSTLAGYGDPTPTRVERSIALPAPAATTPERDDTTAAARTGNDPLWLTIDLEEGSFTVRPGPPGSQVTVDGTYPAALYELSERQDTDIAGRAPRTTIRFRSKAPAWVRMLGGMGGDGESRRPAVTVLIPAGVPIDLSLRVSTGQSRIDLGGLTLSELGLDLTVGNHQLDFKEPVVGGLRRIRLNAGMGNITVENLGNARAQAIDATGSMGNLTADLGGGWQPGSSNDLSFTHSMGQLTLNVPTRVRLEANVTTAQGGQSQPRSSDARETDDPKAPTLRLRVTSSMGESHIVRY
ncbi:MAG TPA: hypothetical protein VI485_30715 [Vicinamibacterales bacterium]|nr:hypothetical protein [Vicinamibacterales bacterium]